MTRPEVATEAFTVGEKLAGPVLGIPFFLCLLFLHGNHRALLVLAMVYVACVVFPAVACVSSAMASFAAPTGQERAYAKAAATWSASVLLALVGLFSSMQIYAYWPFASARQVLQTLVEPSNKLIIPMVLSCIVLVPGLAALGYTAGCHGRRCSTNSVARFLRWCWKLSKKDPLSSPAV